MIADRHADPSRERAEEEWKEYEVGGTRSLRRGAGLTAAAVGTLGLGAVGMLGASASPAPALLVPASIVPASIALHPNHFASHSGGVLTAGVGWASLNWSGYAVTGTGYTSVTGHWKVPVVSGSFGQSFSAAWAGIDGFNNGSLIQTGTEQDFYNGAPHYVAWWTTSSQSFVEQPISEPVVAGDPMSATISRSSASTSSWTITLTDGSANHGWIFSKNVTYTGPGTSAEWVMEAPTVGGRIAPLARYQSPLTFDPGTVNGVSPHLTASAGGELVVQNRYRAGIVSVPSVPDADADGFNMAYGSVAPPAPPS